jgi:urease accessory protein
LIARRRHVGPLLVQRAFHEPDGSCQIYLVHPPGGVVGGDRLTTEVVARPRARALLTTPAATKLYRSGGPPAELTQRFSVGAGAVLEWLPQETIVFDGCRLHGLTRVELAADAQFVGWDVVCLGRDELGFTHGELSQRWEIEREGRLLWAERTAFDGGGPELSARWGLAGRRVVGTLVATGARDEEVSELQKLVPASARDWCSATRLGEVLVCRYLGYSAEAVKSFFCAAWAILRPHSSGREAVHPRVWAT